MRGEIAVGFCVGNLVDDLGGFMLMFDSSELLSFNSLLLFKGA